MDILNDNSTANLPEKARQMLSGKGEQAHHDFFSPLNELDPLTKKPFKDIPPPKFCFRIFYLAGEMATPEEANEYTRVMNKIVVGEYVRVEEQTYHTRDGDIRVFLRWMELSEEELKLRELVQQQQEQALQAMTDQEMKERKEAKELKDKKAKTPTDKDGCPAPDPQVMM